MGWLQESEMKQWRAQVKASPRLPARPKGEVIAFFVKDEKNKRVPVV